MSMRSRAAAGRGGRRRGGPLAMVAAGLAVLLVGCGTAGPDEPTAEPTSTSTPSPSATADPEPEAVDEAAILAAFDGFWAARVQTQQGDLDPTLFDGHATGPLVEEDMAVARNLDQYGLVREGQPGFAVTSVSVDGDRALVSSCVDYTTWVVPEAEADAAGINPVGVVVERIDGVWLVTEVTKARPDLTC